MNQYLALIKDVQVRLNSPDRWCQNAYGWYRGNQLSPNDLQCMPQWPDQSCLVGTLCKFKQKYGDAAHTMECVLNDVAKNLGWENLEDLNDNIDHSQLLVFVDDVLAYFETGINEEYMVKELTICLRSPIFVNKKGRNNA